MENTSLLLGQTLAFNDDPFHTPIDEATIWQRRGAVLVSGGHIVAVSVTWQYH